MTPLLGKPLAEELSQRVLGLAEKVGHIRLVCFYDPASKEAEAYLRQLQRTGKKLKTEVVGFPVESDEDVDGARELIDRPEDCSFAVLRPLRFGAERLSELPFCRDPDCSSSRRKARIYSGDRDAFIPATARSVMALIESTGIGLKGKSALVIGRSPSVGFPVFNALMRRDCFVSLAHSKVSAQDIGRRARESDILVLASGVRGLVGMEDIRPGQVIVDCGYSASDGKGDLGFVPDESIPGWYTPVPGGVGPLTAVSLFLNAYEMREAER